MKMKSFLVPEQFMWLKNQVIPINLPNGSSVQGRITNVDGAMVTIEIDDDDENVIGLWGLIRGPDPSLSIGFTIPGDSYDARTPEPIPSSGIDGYLRKLASGRARMQEDDRLVDQAPEDGEGTDR